MTIKWSFLFDALCEHGGQSLTGLFQLKKFIRLD